MTEAEKTLYTNAQKYTYFSTLPRTETTTFSTATHT